MALRDPNEVRFRAPRRHHAALWVAVFDALATAQALASTAADPNKPILNSAGRTYGLDQTKEYFDELVLVSYTTTAPTSQTAITRMSDQWNGIPR